jgi:hypothetical protein
MKERGLFEFLQAVEDFEDVLVVVFLFLGAFAGGGAAADRGVVAELLAIDVTQSRVGHEMSPLDDADELHHELFELLSIEIRLEPIDPAQAVGYKEVRNQMRKRLKKKRRSCALCKPHKMGKARRWKAAEFDRLATDEKEMRRAVRGAA